MVGDYMFNGIHEISIMLLGDLPISLEILYFMSDLFILFVLFISIIYIILLPVKMMKGW